MMTASGCLFVYYEDNCERTHDCPTAGTGGMPGTSSSSGGTGGTPASCIPSESKDPVADSCGVFVSSSLGADDAAMGRGTQAKPFKSIGAALKNTDVARVYACAESFTEAVTISSSVELYGGLDCKSWAYVGAKKKTTLTAAADAVPLMLTSTAIAVQVEDFAIEAVNAAKAGGSSIAILVDQATASLTRCDLVAGAGKDGADGADAPSTAAQAGANGNSGGAACSQDAVSGGAQVKNACGMDNSIGAKGGDGNDVNGGDGASGLPDNGGGQSGKGDNGNVGWSCAGNMGEGKTGVPSVAGLEGAGALMTEMGTLTSSGFAGAAGKDGDPGKPGQGGGGGGGVRGDGTMAKTLCGMNPGVGGASGGSGGSGGCGGVGGKGGKGAGSSIAVVSLGATFKLSEVTLKAGNGGKGGIGGDSQAGADGGNGGNGGSNLSIVGLSSGCDGGKGGKGGDGGPGGGGRGGHSIGIAYTGTAPTIDTKQITTSAAGTGGPGGNSNLKSNSGSDGVATTMQSFP
jgi:hypothetical protein